MPPQLQDYPDIEAVKKHSEVLSDSHHVEVLSGFPFLRDQQRFPSHRGPQRFPPRRGPQRFPITSRSAAISRYFGVLRDYPSPPPSVAFIELCYLCWSILGGGCEMRHKRNAPQANMSHISRGCDAVRSTSIASWQAQRQEGAPARGGAARRSGKGRPWQLRRLGFYRVSCPERIMFCQAGANSH
jgi:hypothetical protein